MAWTETHVFVDPMVDLRSESDRADALEAELAREIGRGHVLDGQPWRVVAEATPEDGRVCGHDGRAKPAAQGPDSSTR